MERKGFLTAALGVATTMAATALAAAAAPPVVPPPTMAPRPRPSGVRGEYWSNRNISRVRTKLEHVIDALQQDARDYDGHREKALDLLRRARTELLAAEQYDRSHPNG